MLEKDLWSHSSSGNSSARDADSNRRTSCSPSDEEKTSNQCIKSSNMDSFSSELCDPDPILGDRAAAMDDNLFRHQLNNGSNNESNCGLFGNDVQDKESSDLLYYGWPEIENFEDVDRMFRNCDSTFGLEIDKHDELGWFSSAHEMDGSDDALKSSFDFSSCDPGDNNVSEHQENYGLNDTGLLANETDKRFTPASLKKGLHKSPNDHFAIINYSYDDGSGAIAHIENGPQHQLYISQAKERKRSKEKRKERSIENGDSFIHLNNLKPVEESNHSLNFQYSFGAETHKKHENRHQTCSQTPVLPLSSNDNHPSNLASPRSSTIKNEDRSLSSVSLRDASYGSNIMQSVERSHNLSFKNPAVSGNRKKEKLHQRSSSGQLENKKSMIERDDSDSNSAQKQVSNVDNEVGGQSEVDGNVIGIPGELDSSNIQESCVSSILEEVSIEASNFRQLQRVMEQLDTRTKLCIRDSLYRLARSAEQRHKCINHTIGDRDYKDATGAVLTDETNKSTVYMDMETDTNPIDRSIAHLLFHRPSDPSTTVALDVVSAKSHTMVQAATNGLRKTEKLVCHNTTSANNEATKQ